MESDACEIESAPRKFPNCPTITAQNKKLVVVTALLHKPAPYCPGVVEDFDVLVFPYCHGVAAKGTVSVLSFMMTSTPPDELAGCTSL